MLDTSGIIRVFKDLWTLATSGNEAVMSHSFNLCKNQNDKEELSFYTGSYLGFPDLKG